MILDRPPKEWKRPALSLRAENLALKRAISRLLGDKREIEIDHRPALWERKYDTVKRDTIPPANDPDYLEVLTKEDHAQRTHGPGGEKRITTAGGDAHRRAKEKRLAEANWQVIRKANAVIRKAREVGILTPTAAADFIPLVPRWDPPPAIRKPKHKRKIQSRPFQKRKKPNGRKKSNNRRA